jgi:hypothetical protein
MDFGYSEQEWTEWPDWIEKAKHDVIRLWESDYKGDGRQASCHTLNITGWTSGNGSASHGLRSAYRDRATDTVGMFGSGRPTLQHRKDPGPSTGLHRERAKAAVEKDNPWWSSYERAIGRN